MRPEAGVRHRDSGRSTSNLAIMCGGYFVKWAITEAPSTDAKIAPLFVSQLAHAMRVSNGDNAIRNPLHPSQEVKNGNALNDHRSAEIEPPLNNPINLGRIALQSPMRDQVVVGFNQRHIEVPSKEARKCCLSREQGSSYCN